MNPLSNMLEIKKQIADCSVRFAFNLLEKVDKLLRDSLCGSEVKIELKIRIPNLSYVYRHDCEEFYY